MSFYSPSIEKLIESFEKLPSIGHKTAVRLAFHMLNCSEEEVNEFVNAIVNAKKNLKYCSTCYNISDTNPCSICSNPSRDKSLICVVEDVKDKASDIKEDIEEKIEVVKKERRGLFGRKKEKKEKEKKVKEKKEKVKKVKK